MNVSVHDIRKRRVSDALLTRASGWQGEVIVKSDFNFAAEPEIRLNLLETGSDRPPPFPGLADAYGYTVYRAMEEVPEAAWDNSYLVVERFVPERVEGGYAMRVWSFCGASERCALRFSTEPVVKAWNALGGEYCDVPEALRAKREALGFDFGKFDFVMHEGEPLLLDANKTPGRPPAIPGQHLAERLRRRDRAARAAIAARTARSE